MSRPHSFKPPWLEIFGRPCPWFKKQLTSFPQFPRLPKEIQLRIWEIAVAEEPDRRVEVHYTLPTVAQPAKPLVLRPIQRYSIVGKDGEENEGSAPPIALLHTNFDARKMALKRWKVLFKTEDSYSSSKPVYFDVDGDVLHFKNWDSVCKFYCNGLYRDSDWDLDKAKIKQIVLEDSVPLCSYDILTCCSTFPNLERLLFIKPYHRYFRHQPRLPNMCLLKECYRLIRIRDLTSIIQGKIDDQRTKRGEAVEPWIAPIICWGGKEQWRALEEETNALPIFDVMDWEGHTEFESLRFIPGAANDYASLELATRRRKRLLERSSWYERHGFVRRELLWRWPTEDSDNEENVRPLDSTRPRTPRDDKTTRNYDRYGWKRYS